MSVALSGAALSARTSLGVFGDWGAFRDPAQGRCYAIATAQPDPRRTDRQGYMTVGIWPRARVQGQLYWRLARTPLPGAIVTAQIAGRSYRLQVQGTGAWSRDEAMDAALKAAMRSARNLSVVYRDTNGRRFADRYRLQGAATAIDAATLACAQRR